MEPTLFGLMMTWFLDQDLQPLVGYPFMVLFFASGAPINLSVLMRCNIDALKDVTLIPFPLVKTTSSRSSYNSTTSQTSVFLWGFDTAKYNYTFTFQQPYPLILMIGF